VERLFQAQSAAIVRHGNMTEVPVYSSSTVTVADQEKQSHSNLVPPAGASN